MPDSLTNIATSSDNLFILGSPDQLLNSTVNVDQNYTETIIRQFFNRFSNGITNQFMYLVFLTKNIIYLVQKQWIIDHPLSIYTIRADFIFIIDQTDMTSTEFTSV
jgi:hypothetical protein